MSPDLLLGFIVGLNLGLFLGVWVAMKFRRAALNAVALLKAEAKK